MLIVGCGCRGRALAQSLLERGHAVRGTTRDPRRAEQIGAAGAEPFVGDPGRVGTLTPALDGVAVVCLLLGSARGTREELAALHGSRLEMLLQRTVDTTVRGLAYEAAGSVDSALLADGAQAVARACELSRIPYVVLRAAPSGEQTWAESTALELEHLLTGTS